AEAALRAFSAEPLRVDDALAGPHAVDAGSRIEHRHRRRGVDARQEDRIAVVRLGMVTEALGPAIDDRPQLRLTGYEDGDELAVETERLGQRRLDPALDLG